MVIPAYHIRKLSDITLTNHKGLWYVDLHSDGEKWMYHLGSHFKESFCKMFFVLKKATDDIPLDAIQRAVIDNEDKTVKIYVDNSCALAVAIMKETVNPVSAAQARDLYDSLEREGFDVRDFDQDVLRTEFAIFNREPVQLFPSKFGEYRGGGLVYITHHNNTSVKIMSVIEHCSSGHYAIINNRIISMGIPTRKGPENTLREARDALRMVGRATRPEYHDIIAERLTAARSTVASVGECMDIANRIAKYNRQRAHFVKLPKVLDHYKIASPDEKNERWLATNPTHADRLQLFHLLIDTIVVKHPDARIYREKAGAFLFTAGDLEGTEAKRLWSRKVRVQRIKGPKALITHGSDILSDFGEDMTQLDTECDDDDIVSDFGD
jgi:hypothetical protein